MFPVFSCLPRSSFSTEESLLTIKQKTALISDIACVIIFAAAATLIFLSAKGIPLHACSALGSYGIQWGIGCTVAGGVLLVVDIVAMYVFLAKRIVSLRTLSSPPQNKALIEALATKEALNKEVQELNTEVRLLKTSSSPQDISVLEQKASQLDEQILDLEQKIALLKPEERIPPVPNQAPPHVPSIPTLMPLIDSIPEKVPSPPAQVVEKFHKLIQNPMTHNKIKGSIDSFLTYLESKENNAKGLIEKVKLKAATLTQLLGAQLKRLDDATPETRFSSLNLQLQQDDQDDTFLKNYFEMLTTYVKKDPNPKEMLVRIEACCQKIHDEFSELLNTKMLEVASEKKKVKEEKLEKERLEALEQQQQQMESKRKKVADAYIFAPYEHETYDLKKLSFSSINPLTKTRISRESITLTLDEASKSLQQLQALTNTPIDEVNIAQLEGAASVVKDFLKEIHTHASLKIEYSTLFTALEEP